METIKIATGSYHFRGEWKTTEGKIIQCWDSYSYPNTKIFSGTVVGEYPLCVGGCVEYTEDQAKYAYIREKLGIPQNHSVFGDLKNYNTQLNEWSNVVEIPVGCKFTIECISEGDIECFTRFKVTIYHSKQEIKKLEYKYKLKKLDEEYNEDHTLHREVNVAPF
jgi:hypothetical protein